MCFQCDQIEIFKNGTKVGWFSELKIEKVALGKGKRVIGEGAGGFPVKSDVILALFI
jgi:hypothetical protein